MGNTTGSGEKKPQQEAKKQQQQHHMRNSGGRGHSTGGAAAPPRTGGIGSHASSAAQQQQQQYQQQQQQYQQQQQQQQLSPQCAIAEFSYLTLIEPPMPREAPTPVTTCERVRAAFLLSAIGDAVGFNNSQWEHCRDYTKPLLEMAKRGGLLVSSIKGFRVSDETIMALATTRVLCKRIDNWDNMMRAFAEEWHLALSECAGRSPDQITSSAYRVVCPMKGAPYQPQALAFGHQYTSCGAAVRAWPIGIFFSSPDQIQHLIFATVESARITHHHPIAYLSAFAAALFVSFALRGEPVNAWGLMFLQQIGPVLTHIRTLARNVEENEKAMPLVEQTWSRYLTHRNLMNGQGPATFPDPNNAETCNAQYSQLALWGNALASATVDALPGAEAHHCVIIAYDAMVCVDALGLGGTPRGWVCLMERAAMHCGDSDGTGALAAAFWGARYGVRGVPPQHRDQVEMRVDVLAAADDLQTAISWPLDPPLMQEPLRRGAVLANEVEQFTADTAELEPDSPSWGEVVQRKKGLEEEMTKLSIQMDGMQDLLEPERMERKRLLKAFDGLESRLSRFTA